MTQRSTNFVLVDHSVGRMGGHNYQYAVDVLGAAETMGYRPVLAAHREFSARPILPDGWLVLPLFRYGWQPRDGLALDGKRTCPLALDGRPLPETAARRGPLERFISWAGWPWLIGSRKWPQRLAAFEQACAELFHAVPCGAGDVMFLPSLCEFDFLGLIRFLAREPRTAALDWHLQFQFDIFSGRVPDYALQTRQQQVLRRQFAQALAAVPGHRLHFYADTEAIADQYNRLQVAEFQPLPWPCNGRLVSRGHEDRSPATPLRVTCPGVIRREKGKRQLGDLVGGLWDEQLAAGKVQLVFQGQRGQMRKHLPRMFAEQSTFAETPEFTTTSPIVVVRHPLPTEQYLELLTRADVGLFLYNPERYHARCSGVLVEMLAAGVPVIVPAGCWLAEQVAEPNYRYLDALRQDGPKVAEFGSDQLPWRLAPNILSDEPAAGEIRLAGQPAAARLDLPLPRAARDLLLSFAWNAANEAGHYVRAEAEQVDSRGQHVGPQQAAIVGRRSAGGQVALLFHLHRDAVRVGLQLTNAYRDRPLSLQELRVCLLGSSRHADGGHPAGKVGLIAAGPEQVPELLREIVKYYPHYLQSARARAETWKTAHAAQRTVEILQARKAAAGERGHATKAA